MKIKTKNLIISLLLSALGTTFLIYYIFRASVDVVASDYIRIINFYLEDVTDLHYLLSWEGISRIPFTFLARFLNVKLFRYSVFFDKILGTLGLFLFNTVVVSFALENLKTKLMKIIASILITYISFSLMAWEMILNGTGYAHFLTVGLIALTFKIFSLVVGADTSAAHAVRGDNVGASYASPVKQKRIISLSLLIPFTSVLFAGSYAVSFNCTIILFAVIFLLYGIIRDKIKEKLYPQLLFIIIPIICLLLYFKSNNTGEALIPIGFKDISLMELLKTDPIFPIRFLLKSLASSIIGVETLEYAINFYTISEKMIFFIGFLYLIVIIYAIIILIIKIHKLYCSSVGAAHIVRGDDAVVADTIRPRMGELCEPVHISGDASYLIFVSMFFIYGVANYLLVFLARYKFVVDSYGMTSRYSLQYMFLTLGIIMILIKFLDDHAAHIVRGDDAHTTLGDDGNDHAAHIVRGDDVHTTLGDDGNDHAAHTVGANTNAAHIVRGDDAHTVRGDVVGAKHRERPSVYEASLTSVVRQSTLGVPAVGASSTSPKKLFLIIASILSIFFISLGHLTTNTDEIFKADYRKIIYSIVEDKAKNYKNLSDEDLENSFEYHRGPEQIRHAFEILENQNLNIFKK